jgi:hypothetical protein
VSCLNPFAHSGASFPTKDAFSASVCSAGSTSGLLPQLAGRVVCKLGALRRKDCKFGSAPGWMSGSCERRLRECRKSLQIERRRGGRQG